MADFNPDAFLGDSSPAPQSPSPTPSGFNPDAFLASGNAQTKPDVQTPDYETPGQQLLTGVEGAGQGFAGPLATGLELGAHKIGLDKALGIDTSAEAQAGRKSANPWIHGTAEAGALAGSLLTGVGEAGLIAKGAGKLVPEAALGLGKIGSLALKSAIESSTIQAGDEISKSMLGQGDPEAPVSSALVHIGAAGLLGGVTGGFFGAIGQGTNKGLEGIENAKLGDKANDLLTGMGMATKAHAAGIPEKEVESFLKQSYGEGLKYKDYAPGVKLYYSGLQNVVNKAVDAVTDTAIGGAASHVLGPSAGAMATIMSQKYIAPVVEKLLEKPLIGATNKYVAPSIMYALSKGQTTGLFNVLNHATQIAKGAKAINAGVESIFKAGGQQAINAASDKDKQKIMDYIDDGGISADMQNSVQPQPQGFAEGGEVRPGQSNGSISALYPGQDMLMHAAKARVSNYLGQLKPASNPQKLPFDKAPDTRDQERAYHRAIDVAAAPLNVLNHIKTGDLQMDQVKHFISMYPELHNHLSKKLTERIMNSQLDEEKLPYKSRMSLAMFMGNSLDSSMTPFSIQAAQMTYLPKQSPQQGQAQSKTKRGTSTLGKSNASYKTPNEAAESDRSSRD